MLIAGVIFKNFLEIQKDLSDKLNRAEKNI